MSSIGKPVLIRACAVAVAAGAFCAAGWWGEPRAREAWAWIEARNDPAAIAELGLKAEFDRGRLDGELKAALDVDDVDLARSFLSLADQRGVAPSPDLRARYDAATTTTATAARGATDFYRGIVGGGGDSGAQLAGSIAADVTGVGDIRDIVAQGRKIAAGEVPDRLVLGLAVAGLAVTGATIATFAGASPLRAGVSTIKVAAKTGRLSKPLANEVARLAEGAVDMGAVNAAAAAAARFDLEGARVAAASAFKPAALARLEAAAGDVSTIAGKTGLRGAQDALALAGDSGELKRVATLAEARGPATRAVLKTLGRGAFVVASGFAAITGWAMAGVGYVWLALLLGLALVRRAARIAWWGGKHALRGARAVAPPRRLFSGGRSTR